MNPFLSLLFSLFSDCVSVATLALGVWKVSVLSSSSVSSTLELFWFCQSGPSVLVSNFLVFFLSYGRGGYSVLYTFLYFSSIFFLLFNFLRIIFHAFFVLWAFQLYLVSSDTLSAWERAHITSRVICVLHYSSFQHTFYFVLLSPSFRRFAGPVFSNIAPAALLSSISYYNKPQHLFYSFTLSKIYLNTMGYVFGSIRLLS